MLDLYVVFVCLFIIQNEHKPTLAIYFLQTPTQFPSTAKNFVSSSSFQCQKTTSLTDEKSALQQIIPVHLIHTMNSILVQKYLHGEF